MTEKALPSEHQVQIAAYDRQLAEIERMQQETRKFAAEQNKLAAEAGHLSMQRLVAPFIAGAGVVGATAAIVKLFF